MFDTISSSFARHAFHKLKIIKYLYMNTWSIYKLIEVFLLILLFLESDYVEETDEGKIWSILHTCTLY